MRYLYLFTLPYSICCDTSENGRNAKELLTLTSEQEVEMVAAKKNAQTKSYPNNSFDDFLELLKKLKEGIVEPFYVLYGDEPYFIEQIIKEVTTRTIAPENKEFNYAEFNVAISNISDIFKSVNRSILGSGTHSLVVVRGAEGIDDWEYLLPLFEAPKAKGIIILEFKKLTTKKAQEPFFKSVLSIVRREGLIFESVPMYEERIKKVVDYMASANGCKIEDEAIKWLISLFGNSLSAIDNEIRKTASTIAKGQAITQNDLKELKPNREYTPFNLTKAIVERDLNTALSILYYMSLNRDTNNVTALNAAIYSYFQKVFLWGALQRNLPPAEIARTLEIKERRKDEFNAAAVQFPPQRCARIIAKLRELDLKLKGVGSAGDSSYEQMMEVLISIISS